MLRNEIEMTTNSKSHFFLKTQRNQFLKFRPRYNHGNLRGPSNANPPQEIASPIKRGLLTNINHWFPLISMMQALLQFSSNSKKQSVNDSRSMTEMQSYWDDGTTETTRPTRTTGLEIDLLKVGTLRISCETGEETMQPTCLLRMKCFGWEVFFVGTKRKHAKNTKEYIDGMELKQHLFWMDFSRNLVGFWQEANMEVWILRPQEFLQHGRGKLPPRIFVDVFPSEHGDFSYVMLVFSVVYGILEFCFWGGMINPHHSLSIRSWGCESSQVVCRYVHQLQEWLWAHSLCVHRTFVICWFLQGKICWGNSSRIGIDNSKRWPAARRSLCSFFVGTCKLMVSPP